MPIHFYATLDDLVDTVNAGPETFFFSPDTLRFFGATHRHVWSGAYIECQENAPSDDLRWRVTWFDAEGRVVTSQTHPTKALCRAAADAVKATHPEEVTTE